MKTYFILRDFFEFVKKSRSSRVQFKSYKIGGVETLTNAFFIDNQNGQNTGNSPFQNYDYALANLDGSNVALNSANPNTYNFFGNDLRLKFNPAGNTVFGRGKAIGSLNGNDYGVGVLNLGVDIPEVITGSIVSEKGAFFVDIDFTKNLYIEFDILTNVVNGQVYTNPQIVKKYKIVWNVEKCERIFSYYSYETQQNYVDSGNGFLAGYTLATKESEGFPYIDFSKIQCGVLPIRCNDKERTLSFANFVELPEIEEQFDTIKECCYNATVLAQMEGEDYEKNDFTGVFHKKQISGETAIFKLIKLNDDTEIVLNNGDFGVYKDFGTIQDNPNLKTFVLSWQKVLQELGPGAYTILKNISISGLTFEESEINFNLKEFTSQRAKESVRIDCRMDGYLEKIKVDFKNSNFTTSLRFKGFFGRREVKTEEDRIIYDDFTERQISMKQTNEFQMQSDYLPYCITKKIWDFFHFANEIYFNDYNLNNHIRGIVKFPVVVGENRGTNYLSITTKAQLNFTYSERKPDNIKRNY